VQDAVKASPESPIQDCDRAVFSGRRDAVL